MILIELEKFFSKDTKEAKEGEILQYLQKNNSNPNVQHAYIYDTRVTKK